MTTFSFLKNLLEMPQIINRSEDVVRPDRLSMSNDALERGWQLIGTFNEVDYYQLVDGGKLGVRGLSKVVNNHGRRPILLDMQLHPFSLIKGCKQVIRLWVAPEARSAKLATFAYELLVDMGHVIISDKDQLIGGAKLWESFIRGSKHNVSLFDVESRTETPLTKTSDLSQIWTTEPDSRGQYRLLVLFRP